MAQEEGARLGKGNLSLPDAVAQSVGYMGPVFSGTFFIPIIAGLSLTGRGAGIATPFAILLTAIGMLGLAWIISRYAKRIHAAGALYDYVSEGFGRPIGLLAGWVYYGGALMLTLAIGLAFGGFTSGVLETVHGVSIDWIWLTLAFWLVAWAISVLGVRISTRAQLFLALFSVAVVFGWAIYVILKGGSDGFSMRPFNPGESSFSGITYGIVYAGLIFVGFESAANLGEETANPKRNIPRAIFYSVVAAAIFYVVLAWALLLAFGLDLAALFKNFPPLYAATSNPDFGGTRFGEFVQWLVVIDIAAVGLGTATSTMRGIFALARDNHLPKPLAAVHPKYKTPYIAASAVSIAAIIVALIVNWTDGLAPGLDADPSWFPFFQFGATFGAFLLFVVYLLIALTGFKGQPGENHAGLIVAGIVGGLTSVAALYGVVHKAPSLYWFDKIWWLALIWIAIGIVIVLVSKSRGHLASHAPGDPRLDARVCGRPLGRPHAAAAAHPQKRIAASAMRWAQATRSSIGTYSSTVCARWTSPGPKQTAGMPASTVSVAPSCQLSRPPRLCGLAEIAAGGQRASARSGRPRRPRPAARRRRPRRSRADARAATGRARPPRRSTRSNSRSTSEP